MAKLPNKVNIVGTDYTVQYCKSSSDVNVHKRESLWGEIDYWTTTIRVYKERCTVELWKTIFHEILHGLAQELNLTMLKNKDNHDELDVLASVLVDTLIRNGWFAVEEDGETA